MGAIPLQSLLSMTEPRPPHQPLLPPGAIEPLHRDMTVIASADATLGAVQERLREFEQWLPIDGDPGQSLGQLVANNSTGPLRLGYGAWRDLLLGAQFLNGNDELITAGGRTVKNVAGYDLTKFMVGQRGVFGKLVTLTSRTYRRPEAALLATFPADARQINRLLPTSVRPHWAVLRPAALLCGFLGDEPTIAYHQSSLARFGPTSLVRRPLEDDILHRQQLWGAPLRAQRYFRAAVPPTKIAEFVDRASVAEWVADAAFGVVLGVGGAIDNAHDEQERVHGAASAVGGTVYFVEPGGHVVRWASAEEDRLLDALKTAFDPEHRLEAL